VAQRLEFTKMHGAGNDFVVIDATRAPVDLTAAQWRWIADRHRGVGADQILIVEPARDDDPDQVDFVYRIINSDGSEVEQCGNGARCFVRFVRERGLTDKTRIRVRTRSGVIEPALQPDGRVTVDMGRPVFDPSRLPFDPAGLGQRREGRATLWQLDLPDHPVAGLPWIGAVSMGNPHAAQVVTDIETAPVLTDGPLIERHPRFAQRVNAGFYQIVSRGEILLRVYERGAGETLACGTGACAAVASGIQRGLLDTSVHVQTRGGRLTIEWRGDEHSPVAMTGPAETVFTATVSVPDAASLLKAAA